MTEKRYVTADGFLSDSWRLAAQIRASGWRPDLLVALWRGGAAPGVAVHEFLKASGWDVPHAPLECSSYSGIGESGGRVEFVRESGVFSAIREGSKVLVVDDVLDTGRTAAAVKKRIESAGAEMRLACVCVKPSGDPDRIAADYSVRSLDGSWIVFPHEICGLSLREIERKDGELAALIAPFLAEASGGAGSPKKETEK